MDKSAWIIDLCFSKADIGNWMSKCYFSLYLCKINVQPSLKQHNIRIFKELSALLGALFCETVKISDNIAPIITAFTCNSSGEARKSQSE